MTAYYNEFDPYAADWLRNLIADGQIAPGIVDTRDIRDVRPDELFGFRQWHFYAGIGGWSYALRLAGFPDEREVFTFSCPCQPFSAAGKGKGFADERHLWPATLHILRALRPVLTYGEQVASKDGLTWIDLVQADMEGEGYAFRPFDLCSAGIGSPNIRQRQYFVGERLEHGASDRWDERRSEPGERGTLGGCSVGGVDHCCCSGLEGLGSGYSGSSGQREGTPRPATPTGELGGMADGNGRECHGIAGGEGCECDRPTSGWLEGHSGPQPCCPACGLADGTCECEYGARGGRSGWRPEHPDGSGSSGLEDAARERPQGVGRHHHHHSTSERFLPAGAGGFNEMVEGGRSGPVNGIWGDADWLFCRDAKWRPVESSTFPLVDGVSFKLGSGSPFEGKDRAGMLKGYGNAINPWVAAEFIAAHQWASSVGDPVDDSPFAHLL